MEGGRNCRFFYLLEVSVCFLQMGLTLTLVFKVLFLSEENIWVFRPDSVVKTAGGTFTAHICVSSPRFYVQQKYIVAKVVSHHSRQCEFKSRLLLVCDPDL